MSGRTSGTETGKREGGVNPVSPADQTAGLLYFELADVALAICASNSRRARRTTAIARKRTPEDAGSFTSRLISMGCGGAEGKIDFILKWILPERVL